MYVWYSDVSPPCCSTCFLHISYSLKRAIVTLQPWTVEEEEEEEEEAEDDEGLRHDWEWIVFYVFTGTLNLNFLNLVALFHLEINR